MREFKMQFYKNLKAGIVSAVFTAMIGVSSASAQAVVETYNFNFPPSAAPAVAKAMATFSNSEAFGNLKGAVYLNQTDIGGGGTHSFAVFQESPSAANAMDQAMQSSNAARAFVGTISKLGQPAGPSARFNVVKLWGSGKATPRQYQTFAVAATNPAGVVKALDRFRASETGQSSPGDVMLLALRAGGVPGFTHSLVVLYDDRGEYEEWVARTGQNKDWSRFQKEMSRHATIIGSVMGTSVAVFGDTDLVSQMLTR
jgi:hypothetical protein